MPRRPAQTLRANEPEGQDSLLDTYALTGALAVLTFDGGDWDYFQAQLVQYKGTGWTATTVITAQWSMDGANFIGFPTAFTFTDTTTAHDRFRVTGALKVRFIVTTAAGAPGDAQYKLFVRGSQDV